MQTKITIIGAGLTGLTLAYLLQKRNISFQILEADTKIGGRIETIVGKNGTTIEMGATWFNRFHEHLILLLDELDLGYFEQSTKGISFFETTTSEPPQKFTFPDSEERSYRIIGGTSKLINSLANYIPKETLFLNTKVESIKEKNNVIEIHCSNDAVFHSDFVISTIPPNLLVNTISFSPKLPTELLEISKKTHTWMGESIKFGIEYASPFWREQGFSGCVFSQVNGIQEQYDHSGFANKTFALKGFLNGSFLKMKKEERERSVIAQLENLFGKQAKNYLGYYEKVWSVDSLLFFPYTDYIFPHQNNGNPIYGKSYFNNKFFVSGSETSPKYGGYMEGAIQAAKSVVNRLNI
jgi:monoamine oxidase